LDEDGRAVAQAKASWVGASGLDVRSGSGDIQLSSHADANAEVCLKHWKKRRNSPCESPSGKSKQAPALIKSRTKCTESHRSTVFPRPAREKRETAMLQNVIYKRGEGLAFIGIQYPNRYETHVGSASNLERRIKEIRSQKVFDTARSGAARQNTE